MHILYQIFSLFWVYFQNKKQWLINIPIRLYVNKIENRITFEIKKWFYLNLLTSERIQLLKRTKNKITKGENGENRPHLEIAEVVIVR